MWRVFKNLILRIIIYGKISDLLIFTGKLITNCSTCILDDQQKIFYQVIILYFCEEGAFYSFTIATSEMWKIKKKKICGGFRINVLLMSLKKKKIVLFAYPKFCYKYIPQYWSKFTAHGYWDYSNKMITKSCGFGHIYWRNP